MSPYSGKMTTSINGAEVAVFLPAFGEFRRIFCPLTWYSVTLASMYGFTSVCYSISIENLHIFLLFRTLLDNSDKRGGGRGFMPYNR